MKTDDVLDDLVAEFIEQRGAGHGSIESPEMVSLAQQLATDANLRRRLRGLLLMDDLLSRALAPERADLGGRVRDHLRRRIASGQFVARTKEAARARQRSARSRFTWLATGFVLAAVFAALVMMESSMNAPHALSPSSPRPAGGILAVIIEHAVDATIAGQALTPNSVLSDGARIRVGDHGALGLRWPDGSVVNFRRADVSVNQVHADQPAIWLHSGELDAEIAAQPAGRNFRIETPAAQVTVIGTRFHLTATDQTQVQVIEGVVRVVRRSDGRGINLYAGQTGDSFFAEFYAKVPITSGLQLHFSADAGVTIDADARISAWTDRIGGRRAIATAQRRPSFAATAFNGRPAIRFDGNVTALDLVDQAILNDLHVGTVAAWVKLAENRPDQVDTIFDSDIGGQAHSDIAPFEFGIDRARLMIWTRARSSQVISARYVALTAPTAWHHLVYTASGPESSMWIDGRKQSPQRDGPHGQPAPFFGINAAPDMRYRIGGTINQQNEFLRGWIADVRIWDRPLHAEEVLHLARESEIQP